MLAFDPIPANAFALPPYFRSYRSTMTHSNHASLRCSVRAALFVLMTCHLQMTTAQNVFIMSNGSGVGCQGVLYDSGGEGANGYSNNEDYTFTICPDTNGNKITLLGVSFNLDVSDTPLDHLMVFDGPTVNAPLIGYFTGNEFENIQLSATGANTTGCLTLNFQSFDQGTGNFAIAISCGQPPCSPPTALATMSQTSPALICAGDTLTLDGSASYPVNGQQLVSYQWSISGIQSTLLEGATVDHVFDTPGRYEVGLVVVDDLGCSSTDTVELIVNVGLTPSFQGLASSTQVCVGEGVLLSAHPIPQAYGVDPYVDYGEGFYIPDIMGQVTASTIEVDGYPEGSIINSVSDIVSICLDIEHSYMADLVLRVSCPDGSTVTLHEQGGGGTYLGGAQDLDVDSLPVLGDCWTYCWSPFATNGTLVDNSSQGLTPNTILAGTPPRPSVAPGTYEVVGSFSDLMGCPLNGTWSLSAVDLWAADNGFVCGWGLEFAEAPQLDTTLFVPVYGTGCDSSYWSGANLVWGSNACDSVEFMSNTAGTWPVHYSVVDNIGCVSDTTILITVVEPLALAALPDLVQCSDTLTVQAELNIPPTACEWRLVMHKTYAPYHWVSSSLLISVGDPIFTYQCTDTTQVVMIPVHTGDSINVSFQQDAPESNVYFELYDQNGTLVVSSGTLPMPGPKWSGSCDCGNPVELTWQWEPPGIIPGTAPDQLTIWVNGTTVINCSVHLTDQPACQTAASFTVTEGTILSAGIDTMVTVCQNQPPVNMNNLLGGDPAQGGTWTLSGDTVAEVFDPLVHPAGTYVYTLTSTDGCVSSASLELAIAPASDSSCSTIGIPEIATLPMSVYPQPATDHIVVKHGEGCTAFSIVDASGREVQRERLTPGTRNARIDVSMLSPGVYVFQLFSDEEIQAIRWLKQ